MHTTEFAQLNVPLWRSFGRPCEIRPACVSREAITTDFPARAKPTQLAQIANSPEIQRRGFRSNLECRDRRRGCGIGERLCRRLDNRNALAPELFKDQRAD